MKYFCNNENSLYFRLSALAIKNYSILKIVIYWPTFIQDYLKSLIYIVETIKNAMFLVLLLIYFILLLMCTFTKFSKYCKTFHFVDVFCG